MKPANPRGLIFTGELVPGVMSGAVTVTTRLMKPQPDGMCEDEPYWHIGGFRLRESAKNPLPCPFRPGEIRYVKESWRPWGWREDGPIAIEYADGARRAETGEDTPEYEDWYARISEAATLECERKGVARDSEGCFRWQGANPLAWHSPLFLPQYCARTWVEILSVKPVRCQEITREEILASGVTFSGRDQMLSIAPIVEASDLAHLRNAYAALWDRLNGGKRGFPWSLNAWVWRITFRLAPQAAVLAALKGATK